MSEFHNGFRAPPPEELAPLFPKYQILSLIATGGMGAVYHAIQTSLEREVAIKILPAEFGNDPEFCQAFTAEARAMAKLNHPNLIGVYDFGEVNGMLFIVMEYVPGQSLHHACHGSAVEPAEAIRLMTGIAQGLAHAHQHGILHRDIKPANILLDSHAQPKIGDFGLARPVDEKVGEGEAIYGTPGYTAPEVLAPPHAMDQRADIFSLGVLLHELLTGLLPGSDPRTPSAISHCDPRFDAVVHKATHPDARQRYQSATEIADALQKIASSAGPKVLRTATTTPSRRPAPRVYPRPVAEKSGGGVVVVVLLVLVALAVLLLRDRIFPKADSGPPPAPEKPQQADPVTAAPAPSYPEPSRTPPEPGPVVAEPPEPVVEEPDVDEPAAVASNPAAQPEPVEPAVPPKFDVDGFLARARSVMIERCEPNIAQHDAALAKNLADFHNAGLRLMPQELEAIHHSAFEREFGKFVDDCKSNGNRMGDELENKLKFKKWLVQLHEEHQAKENEIDRQLAASFTEQQKTYLYGLGLRVKALREANDPGAAVLIQAEIDKVNGDATYFPGLMREMRDK